MEGKSKEYGWSKWFSRAVLYPRVLSNVANAYLTTSVNDLFLQLSVIMTYSQCSCRACGVGRGGLMVSVWAFLLRWIQIQVAATPWVDWALVTSGIGIIPLSGYSRSYSFITGRNSFSCQTYTISHVG